MHRNLLGEREVKGHFQCEREVKGHFQAEAKCAGRCGHTKHDGER